MLGDDLRSTIWMIGCDFLEATATVFFVRLPLPFRAAGRAVITLFRIQNPPGFCPFKTLRISLFTCQCRQSDSFTSFDQSRINAPLFSWSYVRL